MTWRIPPFDQAVTEMLAHVRAAFAPRGIVIAGSIVRGEAGPTSDLDVVVVHDEPWRLREQRRFAGVPAELFVNPPFQIRKYFASEHADGHPSMAHMLATGEPIAPVDPIVDELIRDARDWLARPVATTAAKLESLRYGAVDQLDNARDVIDADPAAAQLFLGETVAVIIRYVFWRAGRFQPRRKVAVAALDALDPAAAALVRRWAAASPRDGLAIVESLARHALGADTFFAWSSDREPVAP
jgi:nucleotidyltransferase-like protein